MKAHRTLWLLFFLCASVPADPLKLSRVVLSKAGVGYFEHEATVLGEEILPLTVRLDQVDDVLKSLMVLDPGGPPAGVSLPGREPLAQAFRDLPFGREELRAPVELLNRLQGAEVEIQGMRPLEGRLLAVKEEKVALPDELGTVVRHRVYLLTTEGIQQAILEDLDALRFLDRVLEGQVREALAAIERHRARGVRTLDIHLRGKGKRQVRVGYVAETPLWKAGYRLDLQAGRLQGWAILENMSGGDWEGVSLTLTSGHPFSFRQALYRTYYLKRPELPVLPEEKAMEIAGAAAPPRALFAMKAPPPPLPKAREEEGLVHFTFPHPVTVRNGTSAMLPFLDRTLPMAPGSFYKASLHPIHPQSAVEVQNDTAITLPPALAAVYGEGGYLGDAELPTLPPGDRALLGFALDTRIRIHREEEDKRRTLTGSLRHGVLHLKEVEQAITRYRIEHFHEKPHILWIAHPRRPGWSLAEPRGAEARGDHYRLTVRLEPQTRTLTVRAVLERPIEERLAVIEMGLEDLEAFARGKELPEALRQAFARIAAIRRKMAEHEDALRRLGEKRKAIFQDQARIRENLARIPRESELFRRYLDKLASQEKDIGNLEEAMEAHRKALEALKQELRDYLETLEL